MKGIPYENRRLPWILFLIAWVPLSGFGQLVVTSFSPNPACEGTTLTISGSGFTASTIVSVDQVTQTVNFVNANSLELILNTGFVGADSVAVSVTEGGTTVTDSLWLEGAAADLQYLNQPFCTTDTVNPLPVLFSPTGGASTFTASSPGLSINATTGEIDITNSVAGVYTIEHISTTPSGCGDTAFTSVEIGQSDTSSILYPGTQFCENGPDPIPLLSGTPGGTYFSLDSGLVFTNDAIGQVNLSATGPGTYTVVYVVGSVCAGPSASATIEILPAAPADFAYPDSVFCQGGVDPVPNLMSSIPGVFSEPTGGLVIDPQTGQIDLSASLSQVYTVTYITSSAPCPDTFSAQVTIFPTAEVVLFSNLTDSLTCEGTEVELTALGGSPGDNYTFEVRYMGDPNFTLLQDFDGLGAEQYATNSLPSGLHLLRVTLSGVFSNGCSSSDSLWVQVNPVPSGTLLFFPDAVCSRDRIQIDVQSNTNNTQFNWTMSGIGAILPDFSSGLTNILNANETATILTTQVVSVTDQTPSQIRVSVFPVADGCVGPVFVDTLEIVPTQECIFIPGGISPNGDGINDIWEVIWQDPGVDPNDYELEIFNRMNASVERFETLTATRDWQDITLADGPYWYTLTNKSANSIIKKDILIIKRKEF